MLFLFTVKSVNQWTLCFFQFPIKIQFFYLLLSSTTDAILMKDRSSYIQSWTWKKSNWLCKTASMMWKISTSGTRELISRYTKKRSGLDFWSANTLTRATVVNLMDPALTKGTTLQAGKRVHRMGQKYACHIWKIVLKSFTEETYNYKETKNASVSSRRCIERRGATDVKIIKLEFQALRNILQIEGIYAPDAYILQNRDHESKAGLANDRDFQNAIVLTACFGRDHINTRVARRPQSAGYRATANMTTWRTFNTKF